jgi:hypothetical protein
MHFLHDEDLATVRPVMDPNLKIEDLLREDAAAILDGAVHAVAQLEHYRRDGGDATRRRLTATYGRVVDAVVTRDLTALRAHVARVARERLDAGFDWYELQTAFATLEENIWRRAVTRLPASAFADVALVHGAVDDACRTMTRALVDDAPRGEAARILQSVEPKLVPAPADDCVYPV